MYCKCSSGYIYALLHHLPTWTKNLIDIILLIGDALYIKSLSRRSAYFAEINRVFIS